uniref:Letm1 RBD domain-containing protein n=1 Tax=Scylla olivacea TaxID=85551 RepID=A0A0P4WMU8_SCYOL
MSSPAWRCFLYVYRWPRRGCKSQQCLYYWSSLWPWGGYIGHSAPLQVCTIHTAITRANILGGTSVHGTVEKRTKRDVMLYIPQSFPVQHCVSHLSVWQRMTMKTHVPNLLLDRNECVMIGTPTFEPCIYYQNMRYLSGQAQKQVKETEDEKTGKTDEASKGDDSSTVITGNTITSTNKNDKSSTTEGQQASKGDGSNKVILDNVAKDISKNVNSTALGSEQLPSRVQRYFLWRYLWYLRKFHESLKNEMPDTFKMFHIFTAGLKEFMFDFKELIKILVYLSLPGSTLDSLSRRELEVYYRMPSDMVRVFPVLVLSSLPFGQNVAFPIGYWFPRHLLCYHFWDIKQRHEFAVMGLKQRLFNARPVFRCLQAAILTMDEEDQDKCRTVFHKLGSGVHPTVEEIIALIPLFQGKPFHIRQIRAIHVNALLRLYGRSVWLWRRQRLRDHARILHCMDAAISREGLDSLTLDNLRATLIFRGLNPTNMSTDAMLEYLQNWLKVSKEVDASCYSLLLHLPIFLAYNQPTNFALIYSK